MNTELTREIVKARLRHFDMKAFVRESNLIEGITRDPLPVEILAHLDFVALEAPVIEDLERFVSFIAPKHTLRRLSGMNVYVGFHKPMPGGSKVEGSLKAILEMANNCTETPYVIHQMYEYLHPFTDGNGRSGRVLWLHQMFWYNLAAIDMSRRGFLHTWYYQSLAHYDTSTKLETFA